MIYSCLEYTFKCTVMTSVKFYITQILVWCMTHSLWKCSFKYSVYLFYENKLPYNKLSSAVTYCLNNIL